MKNSMTNLISTNFRNIINLLLETVCKVESSSVSWSSLLMWMCRGLPRMPILQQHLIKATNLGTLSLDSWIS